MPPEIRGIIITVSDQLLVVFALYHNTCTAGADLGAVPPWCYSGEKQIATEIGMLYFSAGVPKRTGPRSVERG